MQLQGAQHLAVQICQAIQQRPQALDLGIHALQELVTQLRVVLGPAQQGLDARLHGAQRPAQFVDQVGQQATARLFQHAEPLDQGVKGPEQGADLLRSLHRQGGPLAPIGNATDGIGHSLQRATQTEGQRQPQDHRQQELHSQYGGNQPAQAHELVLHIGQMLRHAHHTHHLPVWTHDRHEHLDDLGLHLLGAAHVDLLLSQKGRGQVGQLEGLAQLRTIARLAGREQVSLGVKEHDVRLRPQAEKGHKAMRLGSVVPDGRLVTRQIGRQGGILGQLIGEASHQDLCLQDVDEGKADDGDHQQQGQDVAQDKPAAQRTHGL